MIHQKQITLPPFKRGLHLITTIIEDAIKEFSGSGILHVFIQHTSAAITINENADPSVRHDLACIIHQFISLSI